MAEPRRLDVDLLRVPDALLVVDGTEYLVRGSAIFGEHLLRLAEVEARLLAAEGEDRLSVAREASAIITELVRIETPKAPELDLNPMQALVVFSHVIGADSVTDALVEALQAGLLGLDQAAAAALLEQQGENGAAEEGEPATPLAQPKRSSGASSRSAKRTAGRRNGGKAAAGAPAGSTSRRKQKRS